MKGDFSRWSFDKANNFTGVLHQQGRVLLDSDWNAGARIVNNWQDQAGQDVIGTGVAAVPAEMPDGFKVESASYDASAGTTTIELEPGRVWVDGMPVYLEKKGISPVSRTATYLDSTASGTSATVYTDSSGNPLSGSGYPQSNREAVILEVWREAVSGFQMPGLLMEPALGGPDTTERIQTQTAFRLLPLEAEENCRNIGHKLKDDFSADKKARLRVSLQPTSKSEGECPEIESGGYSGFEHYLYRVEIAQIDEEILKKEGPYFKWSRFNGGLVGRGKFDSSEGKIKIEDNFQAVTTAGLSSFYLEVLEYDENLGHWKVTYGAEVTLDGDNRLDLPDAADGPMFGAAPVDGKSVFFRLWDDIRPCSEFPVYTASATSKTPATELEHGIRLEFETGTGKEYRPGDYWTFQVRAGGTESNTEIFDFKAPEGIHYHRVPLAIIDWSLKGTGGADEWIHDCRRIFHPLTDLQSCCTVTVGCGGDFGDLQRAIDYLPAEGGLVCLLPGIHEANVYMSNKKNIVIKGCGLFSKVVPGESHDDLPLFHIRDCETITLENMEMVTWKGTAVRLQGSAPGKLKDIEIRNNGIEALIHAVEVLEGKDIRIVENKIRMKDDENGDAAIFIDARGSIIKDNDIVVVPEEILILDFHPGVYGFEPYNPCLNLRPFYSNYSFMYRYTDWLWHFRLFDYPRQAFKAPGGIQIAGGCEEIKIRENRINGGSGNGITLGDIPRSLAIADRRQLRQDLKRGYGLPDIGATDLKENLQSEFRSFLYDIAVEENQIRYMGLNGIGVVGFFSLEKLSLMVSVEDLTVYRNRIEKCLQQLPAEIPAIMNMEMGIAGISLADCENAVIRENRIETNGTSHLEPVSGIFILHGEKIDISDNRILNNGPRTSEKDDNIKAGMRGGIVIALSFRQLVKEQIGDKEMFNHDGIPAVKIHDNIVTQPLGQALFLMAFGPVSVIGNHFTSQSADYKLNPLSLLAGAVTIINLGVSKDLVGKVLMPSFKYVSQANVGTYQAVQPDGTAYQAGTYRAYGSSGMQYAAQPDALYFSQPVYAQQGTGAQWADASLATTPGTGMYAGDYSYQETSPPATGAALFAYALLHLPSGNILFANNQTTLDLRGLEMDIALSSQFIASLDDISYVGNQSECTSLVDVLLTNTMISGVTVRTNDNRFQEGVTLALYSLISNALMNTAAANQATHCLSVHGAPYFTYQHSNSVLYTFNCPLALGWIKEYHLAADTQYQYTQVRTGPASAGQDASATAKTVIELPTIK